MGRRNSNAAVQEEAQTPDPDAVRRRILQSRTRKSKYYGSGLSKSTVHAVAVLLVAIAVAILWNATHVPPEPAADPVVKAFLENICAQPDVFCDERLEPIRRTHKANKYIPPETRIISLPRRYQIWDLDAMRSPYIQKHLFLARHSYTNNSLSAAAYLAAYVALLLGNHTQLSPTTHNVPILEQYLHLSLIHI